MVRVTPCHGSARPVVTRCRQEMRCATTALHVRCAAHLFFCEESKWREERAEQRLRHKQARLMGAGV